MEKGPQPTLALLLVVEVWKMVLDVRSLSFDLKHDIGGEEESCGCRDSWVSNILGSDLTDQLEPTEIGYSSSRVPLEGITPGPS